MLSLMNVYSNGLPNNLINLMPLNYNNNQLDLMPSVKVFGKNNLIKKSITVK